MSLTKKLIDCLMSICGAINMGPWRAFLQTAENGPESRTEQLAKQVVGGEAVGRFQAKWRRAQGLQQGQQGHSTTIASSRADDGLVLGLQREGLERVCLLSLAVRPRVR
jgi:hypothetical protein